MAQRRREEDVILQGQRGYGVERLHEMCSYDSAVKRRWNWLFPVICGPGDRNPNPHIIPQHVKSASTGNVMLCQLLSHVQTPGHMHAQTYVLYTNKWWCCQYNMFNYYSPNPMFIWCLSSLLSNLWRRLWQQVLWTQMHVQFIKVNFISLPGSWRS